MTTIRACKAENIVSNEFDLLQDINTSAYYMFGASSRALSLWLDIVCLVYMAAVILIFLMLGKGKHTNFYFSFVFVEFSFFFLILYFACSIFIAF